MPSAIPISCSFPPPSPLLYPHSIFTVLSLCHHSRSLSSEDEPCAYDPEGALAEVALSTHYMPRHWRGRAHASEVQREFRGMFQLKALTFLEEMASALLTPFVLLFVLPK